MNTPAEVIAEYASRRYTDEQFRALMVNRDIWPVIVALTYAHDLNAYELVNRGNLLFSLGAPAIDPHTHAIVYPDRTKVEALRQWHRDQAAEGARRAEAKKLADEKAEQDRVAQIELAERAELVAEVADEVAKRQPVAKSDDRLGVLEQMLDALKARFRPKKLMKTVHRDDRGDIAYVIEEEV